MMFKKALSILTVTAFLFSTAILPVAADQGNKNSKDNNKSKTSVKVNKEKLNSFVSKNTKFNDSGEVKWASDTIEKLAAKGIIKVGSDNKYKPNNPISELESIIMILRITDNEDTSALSNKLHPKYNGQVINWGMGYIGKAIDEGILLTADLASFKPLSNAKRYEVAKYIVRAMGKDADAIANMNAELTFKDASAVPTDAIGYVYMANQLGVMTANANNQFNPNVPLTRAEMAMIIDRMDGTIDNPVIDKNEKRGLFVSYDTTNLKLTLKTADNKTLTYSTIANVPVYKNSTLITATELIANDRILLIFDKSTSKVIFIQYLKSETPVTPVVTTIEGTINTVNTNEKELTVMQSVYGGTTVATYDIPDAAIITINGDTKTFSNLIAGMEVKLTKTNDTITKVAATTEVTSITGQLVSINIAAEKSITVEVNNVNKTYVINSSTEIIVNGNTTSLDQLIIGNEFTLSFENGKLTKIEHK